MDVATNKLLNNGVKMPRLGLGVYLSHKGAETRDAVRWAIEAGYSLIDTAKVYGNEKDVGEGVRDSGVSRDSIFITTKLWNDDMRAGRERQAFEESLELLGMNYVDLYLMHWPVENFIKSWKEMEKIYAAGGAKAIGVSNYNAHHLDSLLAEAEVVPAVNQIELHPHLSQEPLRTYCREKGIAVEAWKPIGGQGGTLLSDPLLAQIAAKHGKSPAQAVIRWDLQSDIITIPKSVHQKRIAENKDVFDFSLSDEEMKAIDGLNQNKRFGPDPDNFDF